MNELREKIIELLWSEHHREYYFDRKNAENEADRILHLIQEAGYVRLANDQRTPSVPESMEDYAYSYLASQADMLDASFRKAILEE